MSDVIKFGGAMKPGPRGHAHLARSSSGDETRRDPHSGSSPARMEPRSTPARRTPVLAPRPAWNEFSPLRAGLLAVLIVSVIAAAAVLLP